jgi:broad specificity phosphatase PhoE
MYATFALRWNFGDTECLDWWILQDDDRWHDIVRGDGGSYSPGGPGDIESEPGETEETFKARVKEAARSWAKEHGYGF